MYYIYCIASERLYSPSHSIEPYKSALMRLAPRKQAGLEKR